MFSETLLVLVILTHLILNLFFCVYIIDLYNSVYIIDNEFLTIGEHLQLLHIDGNNKDVFVSKNYSLTLFTLPLCRPYRLCVTLLATATQLSFYWLLLYGLSSCGQC